MEHFTALMILIGCSGPTDCHQIAAPAPAYRSVAECRQRLKPALMRAVEKERQAYGACADIGRAAFDRDASVVWNLSWDGELAVRVVDGDQETADSGRILARR